MKIDINLLFRFFKDKHSSAEADALGEWLSADEKHQEAFFEAFRLFQAEEFLLEEKKAKGKTVWWSFAAAAAIAALFMSGLFFNRVREMKPLQQQLAAYERQVNILQTSPGERVNLTLPDGSRVHLNADSRLEYYPVQTGAARRVKLDGEALFEVKSDPSHPFIVETFNHQVKATGTRFNVSAVEAERIFCTTLMKGKVQVSDNEGKEEQEMRPGQRVSWEEGVLSIKDVEDPEEAAIWSKGIISISGIPFDRLMNIFERSFGVNIIIDREKLPEVHYGMAKVRISNGIGYAFSVLQKRSEFKYRYDEETQTYHIY